MRERRQRRDKGVINHTKGAHKITLKYRNRQSERERDDATSWPGSAATADAPH